ncbi:unnamed protein product [Lymnaea stagnalis]|uniref:G-protein coupled receptors family 1 profile domain-containing protein n=1 Tax=Lymnaea stagnalis TaxID=6523 RepID=A0AAV2H5Q1_LYMST
MEDLLVTNNSNIENGGYPMRQIISDQLAQDLFFINYASLGQAINIFGILTNILNILIFIRLGFKDTVNISLFGLTVSDLCSLVTLFFFNICQTPAFYNLELSFEPYDLSFITVGWAHVGFTRVTCCLTAFITLERCLCIALPLKVKTILDPRRTRLIVVATFPIAYASVFPIYCTASLTEQFSLHRNRTLIVMTYNDLRDVMESVSSVVNNIIPVSSFIIIVVCTTIIVVQLNLKSKWRRSAAAYPTGTANPTTSGKDKKVEKMVLFISVIFIVCYLPCEILFVWMLFDLELRYDGDQSNLFKVSVSILYFAETLNASANIFVYYSMSSRYKQELQKVLTLKRESKATIWKGGKLSC